MSGFCLGAPGFEPGKADYESAVLPIETTLPFLSPPESPLLGGNFSLVRAPGFEPGKAD